MFIFIDEEPFLKDAQIVVPISVGKSPEYDKVTKINKLRARQQAFTAAGLYMHNQLVEKLLTAAKSFDKTVKLSGWEGIKPLPQHALLFCSRVEKLIYERAGLPTFRDRTFAGTTHQAMDRTGIVFYQKNDKPLVVFSFTEQSPDVEQDGNVFMGFELRMSFNIDMESATIYKRNKHPDLCKA